MEHFFDSEDMATFYRSLLLLHSPKIDSQRKLYHIMNQSIRKHHPSKKIPYGKKSSEIPGVESGGFKIAVGGDEESLDQTNNDDVIVSLRDPRVTRESNAIKANVLSSRDPRSKVQADTNSDPQNCGSKTVTKAPDSSAASVMNFSLVGGLKSYSSLQPDEMSSQKHPRVSHLATRVSPLLKLSKATPKTSSKHNYCPNPVNLKKIRAVLARGDPFPTHLTKACVNNITPDLQREKL